MLPLLIALQATQPEPATAKVAFPHPLITEVLYSVPGGKNGDANGDGVRSATGDEFIELINPHDKPIELEGYRLSDGQPEGWAGKDHKPAKDTQGEDKPGKDKPKQDDQKQEKPSESADDHEYQPLAFTFPKLMLQPGEVVVVFNGFEAHIPGPVGDSSKAAEKNDKFHGAYVFTMKATSSYQALSNQHDMVVLTSPQSAGAGTVECVRWDFRDAQSAGKGHGKGKENNQPARPRDKHAEGDAQLTENLPNARNSVQRTRAAGEFIDHVDLDGTPFSPGVFVEKKDTAHDATPAKPAPEKDKKPVKGPDGK